MDTSTRLIVSNPSTIQNTQSKFFCNSVGSCKSQAHSNFHTPTRSNTKNFDTNPWSISPAAQYRAPRLLPLISKFEALDAESLSFSVRDAQPSHLRLPRSRMGRQNIGDMKATREKLLGLFERPGWGAKTLRGLRDRDERDRSRAFHDISREDGKESRMPNNFELANQILSPKDKGDQHSWLPSPRPSGRRESRIQGRIRFFDGPVAQSPTKPYSIPSTTKPYRYSASTPKQAIGIRTPTKSYGELRLNGATPSPLRPRRLDDRQPYSPDITGLRGRPREHLHRTLVTPTPSYVEVAKKRVQVIHQDPNRNISEKIKVLHAVESKEVKPERIQKKNPSSLETLVAQALPNQNTATQQGLKADNATAANSILGTTLAKSFEYTSSPAKESKIRDRINLFSNNRGSLQVMASPIGKMRNYSSPTKLPSQTVGLTQNETSNNTSEPVQICEDPAARHLPPLTLAITPENVTSNVALESTVDQQSSSTRGPKTKSPGLAKLSRINDRIRHFEAFVGGQDASTGITTADKSKRWLSPQSKRIRTWPIPAGEKVVKHRIEQIVAPRIIIQNDEKEQSVAQVNSLPILNGIDSGMGKETTTGRDKERDRQRIHARQERLRRRSRSRSRSVASTSGVVNEEGRESARRAVGHLKERFGVRAKVALPSYHEERSGDGMVQEIWICGSEDGPSEAAALVVDTVVAQCELAEPRPMRLAETLRMIKLCRGRFGEGDRKSGTWRKRMGRDLERGGGLAS